MFANDISNDEVYYQPSYALSQDGAPTLNSYLSTGMEAVVPTDSGMSSDNSSEAGLPYLEIIVQPSDRFRFRYKSESGSHGKLRGAAKSRAKTNFPTVKLHNYDSRNKIEIRASLHTWEDNPKPHRLELVGKNCSGGTCSAMLSNDKTAIFCSLEIESKKKDELISVITQNLSGRCENVDEEIKKEIKALNMNAAVLCFEAFHKNKPVCPKVFSTPIRNLKCVSSDLKIVRLSLASGRCSGGEDMILLCDKINKDDIEVRFFEKDANEIIIWEGKGSFNKCDVHHQVAIVLKTPPYKHNIDCEKTVYIELRRPSDNQSGDPLPFIYIPDEIDYLRYSKKRKRNLSETVVERPDSTQSFSLSPHSSASNMSSGTGESVLPGSSGTSPCDNDFLEYLKDEDLDKLLFGDNNLVDIDNFSHRLLNMSPPTGESQDSIYPAFKEEDTKDFNIFQDVSEGYNSPSTSTEFDGCHMDAAEIRTGYKNGIDVGTKTANVLESNRNQFLSEVAHGEMADPVEMNNRTITNKADSLKSLIFRSQNIDNKRENKRDSRKEIETRSFEMFKTGICEILRNRKKDIFLQFVNNLMDAEDENGNKLLHLAVLEQRDNKGLIYTILKAAPNSINTQNKFKETPLHLATINNSFNVLLLLMAHKANASIKNHEGNNCFHLAAKENHVESMKLLLYPILKQGKQMPSIDAFNYDGLTPLHLSIINNAKECMQLLLQAKADVNLAERKTGRPPLHLAIEQEPSLVAYLLEHPDIDPFSEDYKGFSPFGALSPGLCEKLRRSAPSSKEAKIISLFIHKHNIPIRDLPVDENSSQSSSGSDYEDTEETQQNVGNVVQSSQSSNFNYVREETKTMNEEKLCEILDSNGGWKKLGLSIGLDRRTLDHFAVLCQGTSPTKYILKNVKKLYPDYNEETLKNLLHVAELNDTVHMSKTLNV